MAIRKTDLDSLLKVDYHGPIKDQLENSTAVLARMERYTEPTGGKHFYIPLRTTRTSTIGARNDGESELLPTTGRPGYNSATFIAKSLYATVRVTGLAMRSTKKDSYAFARAQVRQMEDTVKDLKKDVNRQILGDGSAELCRVSTAGNNTTTMVVTSDLYPTKPTKFIYPGMIIDTITRSTGAATNTALTVASVDSTSQITLSAAATFATTAIVARSGNIGDNSAGTAKEIKEIYGLYAALNSSSPNDIWSSNANIVADYGGIDRTAANAIWKGNLLSNSGTLRSLSVNLLQQGIDESETVGGGEVTLLQTNYPIYRVYGSMLAAMKQADMSMMKLDGGWEALSVNGKPMVKDVDSPDYVVFCIDESTLMLGVIDDWNWIEDDGGGVLSRLPGQDQYEGVMVRDCQLICDKPIANTIIKDIAHS